MESLDVLNSITIFRDVHTRLIAPIYFEETKLLGWMVIVANHSLQQRKINQLPRAHEHLLLNHNLGHVLGDPPTGQAFDPDWRHISMGRSVPCGTKAVIRAKGDPAISSEKIV